MDFEKSFPRPDSFLSGDRFELVRIFENSSVIVSAFMFFLDIHHVFFEKLSVIMNTYLNFLFLNSKNRSCQLNQWAIFHQSDYGTLYWFRKFSSEVWILSHH